MRYLYQKKAEKSRPGKQNVRCPAGRPKPPSLHGGVLLPYLLVPHCPKLAWAVIQLVIADSHSTALRRLF